MYLADLPKKDDDAYDAANVGDSDDEDPNGEINHLVAWLP